MELGANGRVESVHNKHVMPVKFEVLMTMTTKSTVVLKIMPSSEV